MTGLVGRVCVAHLQTWRVYTLGYPGLVGLAGAVLTAGAQPDWRLLVAWAAPTLGWLSGHYLGDYFDRRLDAISKPQRPIPSGRLRPATALAAGLTCAAASVALAMLVSWRAVVLVVAALGGIVAYSRVFKGRGLSGNAMRGVLTALALMFGVMLTQPYPPWWVLPFALVFWVHDTASNLVGTLRDVDGDRAGGYLTLPVRHGVRLAAVVAALLYLGAIALAAVCTWFVPADIEGYLVLLLVAAGCGANAFRNVLRGHRFTPRAALGAHEILVAERLVLAAAVLAAGAGFWPAVAVCAPTLVASVLAQRVLRARHEFPPTPSQALRTASPEPTRDGRRVRHAYHSD